jgi:hypothetical protein
MAQATDFTLSNQAFGSFRTELNSVLSAVNSCQSGTTTPPSAVAGTIWLDTTSATTPTLKYYDGADNISLATIDHTANTVNWLDSTVSITGLTTTATGTVLTLSDTNLNSTVSIRIPTSKGIDDDSGNEFIKFTKTASAVNEFTIINSATGNAPEIQATGGDTNIDLKITPKGSGKINLDGIKFPNADGSANQALVTDGSGSLSFATIATFNTPLAVVGNATAGSEIRLPEDTDNGSNYVALKAPNTLASNLTLTLPSADGTANQLLKTDGSGNLSFVTPSAGFSGATTTSSATSITLTSASTQVQNILMTAASQSVILPDATTLTTKGSPIYVINNQGAFAFTIKNNSGAFITTVNASANILLTLNDNSTSAGIWSSSAANFNLSWSTYADVITGTKGNVDIGSCAMNKFYLGITASKINSTSAIVCYQKGTSTRDVYGVVISYSGSTITVNSETLLYNGSSTAATNANVLLLDSTTGFLFVSRASNSLVVPFTLSGSTITAGTSSSTFGVGTYNDSTSTPLGDAIAMSSTIALLTESNSTSNPTFTFRTVTHNGASAPTIGTASSSVTTNANYQAPALAKIDATNAFVAYTAASTAYTVARVVTISGASAPTLQTANTSGVTNSGSRGIVTISSTKFNVLGGGYSESYTVSSTTVTYVGVNANSGVFGDNSVHASLGNYVLSQSYNGADIAFFEIVNDYAYYKSRISPDKSYYIRAYGNFSTALVLGLDSTTAFGITNNAGTTTISATVIKYIGI